ncbi:unnamed protein product, partial [Hymenolepis diminuta]
MIQNYAIYTKDLAKTMRSLASGLIEKTAESAHAVNEIEKVAERIKQTEELRGLERSPSHFCQ